MSDQNQPKRAEKVRAERRRRGSNGGDARMKLSVPQEHKDGEYEYRWIKNAPMRVAQLTQRDDWELAPNDAVASDPRNIGVGATPERHGGKDEEGNAFNMVLVRKKKEFYEADKQETQKLVDERENAMRRGESAGPGGMERSTSYIPEGGIRIERP